MKKLTLLICLLASITTFSQNYIGLSGRAGLYKISPYSNAEFSLKPAIGVDFLHIFENNLRFSVGAFYSPKGFKNKIYLTNNIGQIIDETYINYTLNYVSLPILIGYTFPLNKLNIYSNIGVSPAYLLNASYKINDNKLSPLSGEFNNFDISVLFNVGAEFKLGEKLLLNTDVNFNQGLLTVSDAIYSPFKESRNMGLFMTIGLRYQIF